jgi:hypothetical protein
VNQAHGLVAAATEAGQVVFWDPRTRRALASLDVVPGLAASGVSGGQLTAKQQAEAFGGVQVSR